MEISSQWDLSLNLALSFQRVPDSDLDQHCLLAEGFHSVGDSQSAGYLHLAENLLRVSLMVQLKEPVIDSACCSILNLVLD